MLCFSDACDGGCLRRLLAEFAGLLLSELRGFAFAYEAMQACLLSCVFLVEEGEPMFCLDEPLPAGAACEYSHEFLLP